MTTIYEENISFIPSEELIPAYCFSALSEVSDWGLVATGIPDAHQKSRGTGIVIAVLDTGYTPHIDLEGAFILPPIDCTGDGANGFDGIVAHGLHVSGIIAARKNGIGIIGTAPEAKIIPIKVLDRGGKGGFSNIEAGIRASTALNVDIINMSLGAPCEGPESLHSAIKEAVAKGIVLVAAAGNDAGAVNWPARYDEVIAVAALDQRGMMAGFSSHGPQVRAGAPGVDIYSTWLNNTYAMLKGTSQAAPFISGVIALIKSWCISQNIPFNGLKDALSRLEDLSDAGNRVGLYGDRTLGFGIPSFANIDWTKL